MHINHNKRIQSIVRARSKMRSGTHIIVPRADLKVGQKTNKKGIEYSSLTKARKAAKSGEAIVRKMDGIVVSVK